jgi:hypothetical protein
MPRPLEFDIGIQTTSEIDKDGFESTQYDAEGGEVLNSDGTGGGGGPGGGPPAYEKHHFHGFWGRALDPVVDGQTPGQPGSGQPDPTKGAQMLFAMEGSAGHAWTMEDPRVVALLPTPDPGCGVYYGANLTAGLDGASIGVCFVRTHNDGRISLSTTTTNGAPDGQTVYEEIFPGGFVRSSPYGLERFGQFGPPGGPPVWTGYSLTVRGGASFNLGFAGGIVPGNDAIGRTAKIDADVIILKAAVIKAGPGLAPAGSVTKVLPLTAALTQLAAAAQANATASQALATAVAAFTGTGTFPGIAAAASAITAASSQLSAAATAIAALPTSAGTAVNLG